MRKNPDGNVSLPDRGSCTSSVLYSTARGSEKHDKETHFTCFGKAGEGMFMTGSGPPSIWGFQQTTCVRTEGLSIIRNRRAKPWGFHHTFSLGNLLNSTGSISGHFRDRVLAGVFLYFAGPVDTSLLGNQPQQQSPSSVSPRPAANDRFILNKQCWQLVQISLKLLQLNVYKATLLINCFTHWVGVNSRQVLLFQ